MVAKEEIAHDEQFLLLPQCFKKSSAAEASENVCMWERVNVHVSIYFLDVRMILRDCGVSHQFR